MNVELISSMNCQCMILRGCLKEHISTIPVVASKVWRMIHIDYFYDKNNIDFIHIYI